MARYGSREIANVVFKDIESGKPVLYLETLKVSTLEQTADSFYARGGRGNNRLIGWDSNKEMTFMMEDALITPESLALLFGTDVEVGAQMVHKKEALVVGADDKVTLAETPSSAAGAKLFVFKSNAYGAEILGDALTIDTDYTISGKEITFLVASGLEEGDTVIVDYYYDSASGTKQVVMLADKFPGYYTVEAEFLWRDEATGQDVPAIYTIHRGRIMSNVSIEAQAEGDPATFNFEMEVFPAAGNRMVTIDILE